MTEKEPRRLEDRAATRNRLKWLRDHQPPDEANKIQRECEYLVVRPWLRPGEPWRFKRGGRVWSHRRATCGGGIKSGEASTRGEALLRYPSTAGQSRQGSGVAKGRDLFREEALDQFTVYIYYYTYVIFIYIICIYIYPYICYTKAQAWLKLGSKDLG